MEIIKFDNYINENLLKGKREDQLPKGYVNIIKLYDLLVSFGLRPSKYTIDKGVSNIQIYYFHGYNISIYYNDVDEMSKFYTKTYMKNQKTGWFLFVNDKIVIPDENTLESTVKKIIISGLPELSSTIDNLTNKIKDTKRELKSYNELLDGLKKAKEYINEN